MILDGHVHIMNGDAGNYKDMLEKMHLAGVDGGIILSLPPKSFENESVYSAEKRLDNLFKWADINTSFYPFFWIDPTEKDALDQVVMANERGITGYKVICNHFYPGDKAAMKVYTAIANAGKPILFHSGILWDGTPSSKFNRPGEFEALLEVNGLKFALAHVSWPWCDENIAVYGKFLNAYTRRPDLSVEMFIDITPGTPPIYREEVLTKLFTVGYDIENNIIFGSDSVTDNYNHKWVSEWIERDNVIYNKLKLDKAVIDKVYSGNLQRFIGLKQGSTQKRHLRAGE